MADRISADRNAGVDLLRIVAMVMVFAHHFLGHGLVLNEVEPLSLNWFIFWFVKCACYMSVTSFYLISAYYQSKKSNGLKSIIKIWLQVEFYSVVCYGVSVLLGITSFGLGAVKAVFPVMFRQYGFFNGYLLMAMLSPFLNKMFSAMERKMHICFIILLGVVCTIIPYFVFSDPFNLNYGEGTLWIVLLYSISAFLQKYVETEKFSVKKLLLLTLGLVGITYLSKVIIAIATKVVIGEVKYSGAFVGETQIFMLCASVALFILFLRVDGYIQNKASRKAIAFIAPLVFSVFLVTENNNLRNPIWRFFEPSQYANKPIYAMLICFVISLILCFALPMAIEKLRTIVENKLKLSEKLAYLLTENVIVKRIGDFINK